MFAATRIHRGCLLSGIASGTTACPSRRRWAASPAKEHHALPVDRRVNGLVDDLRSDVGHKAVAARRSTEYTICPLDLGCSFAFNPAHLKKRSKQSKLTSEERRDGAKNCPFADSSKKH
jgi:hypothetical protein